MGVHFKFKSAKDPDFIPFDGSHISVADLKEKIVEKKKLRNGTDYDIILTNAQSGEEYMDEECMIPRNTSVLVRRVPSPTGRPTHKRDHKVSSVSTQSSPTQNRASLTDDLDDFGSDLYSVATSEKSEDDMIRDVVTKSALHWQTHSQQAQEGANRGMQSHQVKSFQNQIPHRGYICHRCGVEGHFIQHCPTNGDPTFDKKRIRPPTGIPKSMLIPDSDGTYFLPTGEVCAMRPNDRIFDQEVAQLPSWSHKQMDFPPEFRCPLCQELMKDAVLTGKCCFRSYCDKCIRSEIISKRKCACGMPNVLADDLLPNVTLRNAIQKILENQVSSGTSSGNVSSVTSISSASSEAEDPVTKRRRLNSTRIFKVSKDSYGSIDSGISAQSS